MMQTDNAMPGKERAQYGRSVRAYSSRQTSILTMPAVAVLIAWLLTFATDIHAKAKHPNFLVIVADDMAWSDIGAFGSEIRTPSIDGLAARGMTMSNFYVAPTCSPTRAMLMTGVDNHLAGVGTMAGVQTPNQLDSINYAGQLHDGVVTVAEALKAKGYTTLMSGKWHLATDPAQYPHNRGFDRSFMLGEGGASHFADAAPLYRGVSATYLEDGAAAELPEDFYSSTGYTDKMLEYLDTVDTNTPVFAYVAYTAPHDPLQAPDDWLDRYQGIYSKGPAALRAQRIQALSQHGLFAEQAATWTAPKFPPFLPTHIKPWEQLTDDERAQASKPMEIYAAMVELMDTQIQRLINALERSGRLENTYIIFMSDNGANGATPLSYPNNTRDWFLRNYNHKPDQQGRRGTHTYMGREWAWATAAPFKLYKGAVAEGGIRAPLIVAGPEVTAGSRSQQLAYITDLPATLYELAGIDPTSNPLFDKKIQPEGRSLTRNWQNPKLEEPRKFALELFGSRGVISDHWKATNMGPPLSNGKWELFDLSVDAGEMHNVADQHPEKVKELAEFYSAYKKRTGIIAPDPPVSVSFGDLFTAECNWFCGLKVSVLDTLIKLWQKITVREN